MIPKSLCCAVLATMLAMPAVVWSATTGSGGGNITVTLLRPLSMIATGTLGLGTLVRGAGTGSVSAAGIGAVSGDVGRVGTSGVSSVRFTVSGEGGQGLSISVPATVTMTSGANSLTVTTTSSSTTGAALSGSAGSAGSYVVDVGGSVTLTATTARGNYTGTLTVTASYQ